MKYVTTNTSDFNEVAAALAGFMEQYAGRDGNVSLVALRSENQMVIVDLSEMVASDRRIAQGRLEEAGLLTP